MKTQTWINHIRKVKLREPSAIVGSPGLRSIGKLVVDNLVDRLQAKPIAELYSNHFPVKYHTKPSYAPHYMFPGDGGVNVNTTETYFPRVQFYSTVTPALILTRGYHANFKGQYEVAERVLDLYEEYKVKKIIVIAGYGTEGSEICCAATDTKIVEDLRTKHGIEIGYKGRFYGFSGLVFGLSKLRGIEALCLFGKTLPKIEDPEHPDEDSAKTVVQYLTRILDIE
jgi:proteasome assembly chaperone (PAC2) family protein